MIVGQGADRARLLVTFGADRDDRVMASGSELKVTGSSDFRKLIDPNQPYHQLRITPKILRQSRRPDFASYDCIVNLITEPEQNDRVLDNLRKLVRGARVRVINRPEAVLCSTRDQIARRLAGMTDLLVPKVVRLRTSKPEAVRDALERADLQFPIIVREAGTHTGMIVGRIDSPDEMPVLAAGVDHFATEFVDFKSDDGLYRKYRAFYIGPHRVFRHKLVSDHWNVHGKDRDRFMIGRPDLIDEEKALFATAEGAFEPRVGAVLDAIRERMDLDFFGVDFGIMPDGRVVLFEANATMSFYSKLPGPEFDYLQACLPPARTAFRQLIGP